MRVSGGASKEQHALRDVDAQVLLASRPTQGWPMTPSGSDGG